MKHHKPLLLVFPYNALAHYLRCIELSKYLRPYFHIKFLHSSCYAPFIAASGFETFVCATLDAANVQSSMLRFDFSWLNENDLSHIYKEQVKRINEQKAVAVLGDMSPTLAMAAEKTGVSHISLLNGYMSRYYACVRRMPRTYPYYKWFTVLPDPLCTYLTSAGEQILFRDLHRPFKNIRKRAGLTAKYSYLQELEGDLNLICDLRELFPQKDLPANYHFIPPLFHPLNDDDPIPVEPDGKKKTLLVSMGSTGDWNNVAFLNGPEYRQYNIITAGDKKAVLKGENIFPYSFIHSNPILETTDVLICHGGNGTTYQALSKGIPVLCKTSHAEQDYNVQGLERLKIGQSLDSVRNKKYKNVIHQWTQEKGSQRLLFIKEKITDAKSDFGETINKLVTGTVNNLLPATSG